MILSMYSNLYSRQCQIKFLETTRPFQKPNVLDEFLSPPYYVPILCTYFEIINF